MADHWSAAIDALRAAGLRVHDGDPTAATDLPYVVVYRPAGQAVAERLDAIPDRVDAEGTVHAIGRNAESVLVVARRARDVLTARLPLSERVTWRGVHVTSQAVRRDQDVTDRVVFYGVDVYQLSSVPA